MGCKNIKYKSKLWKGGIVTEELIAIEMKIDRKCRSTDTQCRALFLFL